MNRRDFAKTAALLAASPLAASPADPQESPMPDYQKPVFDLHKHVKSPVTIASIELLQNGRQYFVRTRSTDGAEAVILTKDMEDFVPILHRRVIPTSSARTRAISRP
jgi:hypothetical protein